MAASLPGVPVITGPERIISGRLAIDKFAADVLVLDDGFQHRRLARDVDILMIDGQNPFGNRRLLPAGPLREDPRSALDRADIVVKTVVEKLPGSAAASDSTAAPRPVYRAAYEATGLIPGDGGEALPPKMLQDKKILAFTAIAAPEKFRATLTAMGAEIIKFLAFPDHYFYKESDVRAIVSAAKEQKAEMIVTTEKDGVKLANFQESYRNLHILSVGLRIDPGEEVFFGALIKLMQR
jgi:tetraacyldisaccharide 4'-kinase